MPDALRASYSRRVSFNERIYLAAERLTPGFCIQIVVEGRGQIARAHLERAIEQAALANPGARLVLRGVLGFTRWVAVGPLPPLRVLPTWEAPGGGTDVQRALPPATGPTCEVVYAEGDAPRLVFRCFHGVMDARGLLHFAEDVFRALRGEELVGSDFEKSDTELVESLVGPRKREGLKSDRRTVTGGFSASATRVIWRRVTLEGALPALVARVSVTLAAFATKFHSGPTRIMIPVDLRNYARSVRATGNLTYPLFLDVKSDASFREVHTQILKRLASKEAMHLDPAEKIAVWLPLWLLALAYAAWIRGHRRSGWFPFSALVTHAALGEMALFECAGFGATALYFLPPDTDFIPLAVSAVSSRGAAELVVSAPSGIVSDEQLTALCDALRAGVS